MQPETKSIPMLMMAAAPTVELVSTALQGGAVDFLRKPPDPVRLQAALARAVARKKTRSL